jgi:hypothetical protein
VTTTLLCIRRPVVGHWHPAIEDSIACRPVRILVGRRYLGGPRKPILPSGSPIAILADVFERNRVGGRLCIGAKDLDLSPRRW